MHEYGRPVDDWAGVDGEVRFLTPRWGLGIFATRGGPGTIAEEISYFSRVANEEFKRNFRYPEPGGDTCMNSRGIVARVESLSYDWPLPIKEGETYIHTPGDLELCVAKKLLGTGRRVDLKFDAHGINAFNLTISEVLLVAYEDRAKLNLSHKDGLLWVAYGIRDINFNPRTFLEHEVNLLKKIASLS